MLDTNLVMRCKGNFEDSAEKMLRLAVLAVALGAVVGQCPTAPTLVAASGADGELTAVWAPAPAAPPATAYRVSVQLVSAPLPLAPFGACSAARSLARTVAGDVTAATFSVVNGASYSVTVAAVGTAECGTGPASAPLVAAVVAPRLPTADLPALWLDAESLPTMSSLARNTTFNASHALPDVTRNWWFRLYGTTSATTKISLSPRSAARSHTALGFAAAANDFFVHNTPVGATSGAADTATFGWAAGAAAINDLTIVVVFQSILGGYVVTKGACVVERSRGRRGCWDRAVRARA